MGIGWQWGKRLAFVGAVLAITPVAAAAAEIDDGICTGIGADLPEARKPADGVLPKIPSRARGRSVVVFAVDIGDDGRSENIELLCETPEGQGIAKAVRSAVKQWRFPEGNAGRFRVVMRVVIND